MHNEGKSVFAEQFYQHFKELNLEINGSYIKIETRTKYNNKGNKTILFIG